MGACLRAGRILRADGVRLCCLTSLLGKQPVKGVLAAMIGLGISVVGVDSNSGVYRYTFDSVHLSDGIDFVVVVIALFAVSEMLEMLEKVVAGHSIEVKPSGRKLFNLKELSFTWWSVVRSSLVGFGVGVLPGAGANVAAAVAYSQEKRIIESKDPDAKVRQGAICAAWWRPNRPPPRRQSVFRAHADAGRARLGHHRRDDGRVDALQHHARSGAVRQQARTGVGPDCLAVHRQRPAVYHERADGAKCSRRCWPCRRG